MSLLRSPVVQVPYRAFHRVFLLHKEEGNSLADLDFDISVKTSVQRFRSHSWTWQDAVHYGFLLLVIFFVYVIFPASFWIKTPILAAFVACFLMPLTSQFFLYALPIFSWLALFFSASKIPNSWKPAISVKFLPAMETILYGDNLSNVLAETHNVVLDVLAWLPYGLVHFVLPFVVALMIFLFAPPTSLRLFGFAFGYMNLVGVLIQLGFPAAPPWYKNLHGLEPANYSMDGSPGGLGRIDELLGVDMYTSTFQNSPLVFGAFPSLHSGCAIMDVLFLCWLFPRYTALWYCYACWLWWSTMYLTHHYFIDLIFGAVLSFAVFTYVKYTSLPVVDPASFCRWLYTRIGYLDMEAANPLKQYAALGNDAESAIDFYNPPSINNADFEMVPLGRPLTSQTPSPSARPSDGHASEGDTDGLVFDIEHDQFEQETRVSLVTSTASLPDLTVSKENQWGRKNTTA